MTFCGFDEFEDAVLSVELAAEKFHSVQTSPTLWKWVIIALQNAVQGAMVLALAGTDGCGALFSSSQEAKPRVAGKSNAGTAANGNGRL
jgi:hypothetical protein